MAKKLPDDIPDPIMEFFVKLVLDEDFRDRFAKGTLETRRALTEEVESFKQLEPSPEVLDALLKGDSGTVALVLGPNQQTAPTDSDAILDALDSALAARRYAKSRNKPKKR